jgi:hypothetical protein
LQPGRTGMHHVTHRSHWMQKHKFGVTCPCALFMKSTLGPLEHEKECVDVSCPRGTRMHYMSRRFHRMQEQKFTVTCPGTLFSGNNIWPTRARKIVRRCFAPQIQRKALRDPHIRLEGKTQVQRNMSQHTICGNGTGPIRA